MNVFGLFRADVNIDEFADEPRWFLEGLLRGETEVVSAERAGVTLEEVRRWASDSKFRSALKDARRGIGSATATTGDRPAGAPTGESLVITLDANGEVVSWKPLTSCFACRVGGCTVHTGKQSAKDPAGTSDLSNRDRTEESKWD